MANGSNGRPAAEPALDSLFPISPVLATQERETGFSAAVARAARLVRVAFGLIVAGLFLLILAPPRRIAQILGLPFGRGTPVAFHRLLCLILRVRVHRFGAPSDAPARLIVANHVSWLDILVLGALEPMTFLAKKQVGGPFLGRQLALLQGVAFVDRERKRCIPEVNRVIARTMASGEPVALFAEATTGDGNRLLRFRSSHFEAVRAAGPGAVAQPVYLNYCRVGGLPVARADRPLFAWYGDMTFLPHLWRVIFSGAIACEVHYGDPVPVASAADRKGLARETERALRILVERARDAPAAANAPRRLEAGPRRALTGFTSLTGLPAAPKTG